MKDNKFYFDINRQDRDTAIRYLLEAILKCREGSRFPSNSGIYDEDVNVYLAHLLFAISLPDYHDMAEPYLSRDSHEIMKWVNDAEDQTIRYFIFKVNADHILVHSTIFDDLASKKGNQKYFKSSAKYYAELAKLYYEQAAAYHKRIYRKKTGVGDVLDKMACEFDSYKDILDGVRKEYFHFISNFKDQAFSGFVDELNDYEKESSVRIKMDEFLDYYGQWLESKDKNLEEKICNIVSDLRALDPDFKFDLAERFMKEGGTNDEKKCA